MKSPIPRFAAALLLAMTMPVANAQDPAVPPRDVHHAGMAQAAVIEVPPAALAPVAVVEAFGVALASGDFAAVESMLAPDVIILEAGGAERSRTEYLEHHAKSDASSLSGVHAALVHRKARVEGDLAWVASESEWRTDRDGEPRTLLSAETMVLAKAAEEWRIVHIHWSSRPKKEG